MVSLLLAVIYLTFISLGLPDGLLGSAWPSMYEGLGVPVSYMGIISFIISAGTVVSSLMSDRLTHRFGVSTVTTVSVAMTALSILGFSISKSFILLCAIALPYGLGAGSIDAALNNYVALHYETRHMSWLHCMWGVGASLGPVIMGMALNSGKPWHSGYLYVGLIQAALTALLFCTLGLWKSGESSGSGDSSGRRILTLRETVSIPGVTAVMGAFFFYCAVEQTAGQWAASFLVFSRGVSPAAAARLASVFYIGITVGRFICGFITFRLNDAQMIRLGFSVLALGIVLVFVPNAVCSSIGLITVGLGCAPVYPSLIHATPAHFGADKSQAVIGVQMASAYVGTTLIPPLFGILLEHIGAWLLPICLCIFLAGMVFMNARLEKLTAE